MQNDWEDFYCKEVLSGSTPVEIVLETKHSLAFYHTRPYYEVHIAVIPKKHILLITIKEEDLEVMKDLCGVIKEAAAEMNEKYGACTVSTNIGEYQSNKHMHWHVHFGKRIRD
ncbi:HIT domain-containing protein [Bacillus sp. REN3]|uniref:HIT family protein n=1 Tax=Bacillus sp. REN3 TaxID=2802440 RepID=UPI001AEE461A|nr:HIT domain-containing protein [Bacillus sp. REN3]